jgi:hypothetical protein
MHNSCWFLVLMTGCGSSLPPPPAAAKAAETEGGHASERTSTHDVMRDHFSDLIAARDGLIAGRLDFAQGALRRLATRKQGDDTPDDWRPWISEMQALAERGSTAMIMADAAASVAAVSTNCGECHRATRGGRRDPTSVGGYDPRDQTGLEEKMARHQFAADELWLGLTGPSHEDWVQGAAALMNIQVHALVTLRGTPATRGQPTGTGELQGTNGYTEPETPHAEPGSATDSIDVDAALRELRELGRVADNARVPGQKNDVFAQILVRCGSCHAQFGVVLL